VTQALKKPEFNGDAEKHPYTCTSITDSTQASLQTTPTKKRGQGNAWFITEIQVLSSAANPQKLRNASIRLGSSQHSCGNVPDEVLQASTWYTVKCGGGAGVQSDTITLSNASAIEVCGLLAYGYQKDRPLLPATGIGIQLEIDS
jgi:hypothetical protein